MTCATCGSASDVDDSTGGTVGEFREEHSCVNGHWGVVRGDTGITPDRWDYRGPVFEERGVA